jgi:hypothetical protein
MFRQLLGDCAWEPCPGDWEKAKRCQKLSERPCLGDLPGRPGQDKMVPEALPGRSFVSFLETAPGRPARETGTRQNVTRSSARQVLCQLLASVRGRPARETGTRQNVTRSSSRQVFRQVPGVRARETCPGVQDKAKYYQKLSQAGLPSASRRPRLRTCVVSCSGAVHSLGRQGHRNTQAPAASHSCQPQLDSHSSAT